MRRSAHSPWFTAQLLAVLCSAGCLLPDYGSPNGGGGEGGASGGGGAGGSAPPVCDGPRPARIWRFGSGNADETVSAIVPLPDGAVVVGEFQGEISYVAGETKSSSDGADGFVMRVDEAGTALWLTAIVVTGDLSLKGARQLPDGAVIVGGEYEGTLSTPIGDVASVGGVDAFVARVSAEGDVTHMALLGSAEDDRLGGVDVAADGTVVLALGFTGPALILQEFYTEPSANLAYARLAGKICRSSISRSSSRRSTARRPSGSLRCPVSASSSPGSTLALPISRCPTSRPRPSRSTASCWCSG